MVNHPPDGPRLPDEPHSYTQNSLINIGVFIMFEIQNKSGGTVELTIYDVIGRDAWTGEGVTAKQIADAIGGENKTVRKIIVNINSPGGSVFEAIAIHNALKRHKGKVTVNIDGAALSAASIVVMAGDRINIAENGLMMIHDPVGALAGTADEIRKMANLLDKSKETLVTTYASRTDLDRAAIAEMMTAETWFSADEALAAGFADKITPAKTVSNLADGLAGMRGLPAVAASFKQAPDWLRSAAAVATSLPRRPPTADDFDRAVSDLADADGISEAEARKRVAHEQPELYRSWKAAQTCKCGPRPAKK